MCAFNRPNRLNLVLPYVITQALHKLARSRPWRPIMSLSSWNIGKRIIRTPLSLSTRPLGDGHLEKDIIRRRAYRLHWS